MNADHDFQIGKNHLVCQDYSLVSVGETESFAILCDGCSASPDVDIGARALAIAARETFLHQHDLTYEEFGERTILRAASLFDTFPSLHCQTMDATLLIASVNGNMLKAFIYGDGVYGALSSEE